MAAALPAPSVTGDQIDRTRKEGAVIITWPDEETRRPIMRLLIGYGC
jgi:hypothetical protein